MIELTLRDRIFAALTSLPNSEANYSHHINRNGDPLPQCHFCGEIGLFVTGNGGILHLDECACDLIYRIPEDVSNLHFFDQLAYMSLLRQIANFTQYPREHRAKEIISRYFCPFCKNQPRQHQRNCIVTLAQAELEQQGGEA